MMKIRWVLLIILLPVALHAQRQDFQSWWEAEFEKDLGKDLSMSLELEQRLKQNSTRYDRSLASLAIQYDIWKTLRVAGGIRTLAVADREGKLHPKYRIHADLSGRSSLGEVDLSLRVRFQYGFEEFLDFNDYRSNIPVNRYRLKAAYHIFGTPLNVHASFEPWGALMIADQQFIKRLRYTAGLDYALGHRMSIGLRYILEDEINQVNPWRTHILVAGLSYEL